jgi:hypothetical protein
MKELFKTLLEASFFADAGSKKIALVFQISPRNGRPGDDSPVTPRDFFPSDCEVRELPEGEDFLQVIREVIDQPQPVNVFIIPPILYGRELSDHLRAEFPMMSLGEIILTCVAQIAAPGSIIGVMMPNQFLLSSGSARTTRESLRGTAAPRIIISHDHPVEELGIPIHSQFRMGTVIFEKTSEVDAPVRFFKLSALSGGTPSSRVTEDFRRLLTQPGGKTAFGFVLRDGLPVGEPWNYDAYHPDLARRRSDLGQLGKVQTLGDLVEIEVGTPPAMNRPQAADGDNGREVILLKARQIGENGQIMIEESTDRSVVGPERILRSGDICIRANYGNPQRLICGELPEGLEEMAASHSVIVLRPRSSLDSREKDFLLAYLRSSACLTFLKAHGFTMSLRPRMLENLPVPIADQGLQHAVEHLGNAATQFRTWADELEAARGMLFDSESIKNARLNALSAGRLGKQRHEAAVLVSDFAHRVRTRFPHPIAYRWRTVEAQQPDMEGYVHVLECAETTITYLAVMALILAKSAGKTVGKVADMAEKFSTTGHGTCMGDWAAILQEAKGARFSKDLPETTPFIEITKFQESKKVEDAIGKLSKWRNEQSHQSGPKGPEVPIMFEKAKAELGIMLDALDFLTDYPLYYIVGTKRDSLLRVTRYEFRQMMGDHALVPVSQGISDDTEIEKDSLYLADRAGNLHLLRPLLIGRHCPECQTWSSFFLNSAKTGPNACEITMKSMEHGHKWHAPDTLDAFKSWGMIQ